MERYNEFEEMKAQLALLNKKLEQETIVNERLIRRSMKEKASSLRRKAIVESIISLIMIPYFIWVMPQLIGLSTGFCLFVCFMLALALGYNYYIHSHFRPDEFVYGDLIKAKKNTLMLKKFYANWLKFIGIPFIIVFLGWFAFEIKQHFQGEELQSILGGMAIGLVLGVIIGTYRYLKTQRMADDILTQIEELSED
jgi:hypothetical protein